MDPGLWELLLVARPQAAQGALLEEGPLVAALTAQLLQLLQLPQLPQLPVS